MMVQELPERRAILQQGSAAGLAASLSTLTPGAALAAKDLGVWKQVDLPIVTEAPILFDIEFDPANPKNGWIVGNRGTFLQTTNGGVTWTPKSFANLDPDEEINYRFTKVAFKEGEGWIIGKPAILLHTRDSGASWERVPLSPKLPGDPYGIVALGPGKAEMTTSAGAIYTTENAGRNWKAEVRETIDATLNRVSSSGVQGASYFSGSINSIERDADGAYLAVSARGNFYLTFKPGDEFWIPHNRETSRRITSMGFVKDRLSEGLWMTTAGGEISKTTTQVDTQLINIPFDKMSIRSGGYGLLDIAFTGTGKAFAVGGGGTIFESKDNGQTWTKDKAADDLPSNLYKIKVFGDTGYILGSNGVLLRGVVA
uniref:Photosynthesis system II assembly factor Ycf48/Hcf136-like domain-containing protein n=1 Tax=Haptolina ericina TaxID=156174 RepID=A0A7S3FG57_9EUKA